MAIPPPDELATKLASLAVTVEGSRRPVLIETILEKGLERLRPGSGKGREVLVAMIQHIHEALVEPLIRENEELLVKTKQLEQRVATSRNVFDEKELSLIRTYFRYGLTVPEIAPLFRATENQIFAVLKGKVPMRPGRPSKRDLSI